MIPDFIIFLFQYKRHLQGVFSCPSSSIPTYRTHWIIMFQIRAIKAAMCAHLVRYLPGWTDWLHIHHSERSTRQFCKYNLDDLTWPDERPWPNYPQETPLAWEQLSNHFLKKMTGFQDFVHIFEVVWWSEIPRSTSFREKKHFSFIFQW